MVHPVRFREDDPHLLRVREIALLLPGASERLSHGRPSFFTSKAFAVFGGSKKGDHASDVYDDAVLFKPDPDERLALLEDERCFVPAYVGPSGWMGLNLRVAAPDWAEVAELLDMSYRNTAPRRLIAELNAAQGAGGGRGCSTTR